MCPVSPLEGPEERETGIGPSCRSWSVLAVPFGKVCLTQSRKSLVAPGGRSPGPGPAVVVREPVSVSPWFETPRRGRPSPEISTHVVVLPETLDSRYGRGRAQTWDLHYSPSLCHFQLGQVDTEHQMMIRSGEVV